MKVTAEDIAQLLASAPPRIVPKHVARAAMASKGSRWLMAFFLGLVGFGLWVGFRDLPVRLLDEWRLERRGIRTHGVVLNTTETDKTENEVRVHTYTFRYTIDESGQGIVGECFTTGRQWEPRAAVAVRYDPEKPDVACIEGARLNSAGWIESLVVTLMPLIVCAAIVAVVSARRGQMRLLRDGLAAEVEVISVDTTGREVSYETEYAVVLTAPPGVRGETLTLKRTAKAEINMLLQHELHRVPVDIIYDPAKPEGLIFPEALIDV